HVGDEVDRALRQAGEEVREALGNDEDGPSRRRQRTIRLGGVVWGGVLLVVGAFLLSERLGLDVPSLGNLWPIFPFMFGVAFLVSYFLDDRKDPGLVWPGTFGVLLGTFFFLFVFDVFDWSQMSILWPAYPLMVGLSFVATWLAGRCADVLIPAAITLAVGGVGLAMTTGVLEWGDVRYLWPMALIAIGGSMVVSSLRRRAS
ncbi:MAG: hypothetical protein R3190_07830, partial [Thermoanaerobaculia bacterium]|nr:hypothetical protein [Thermoanaerobaculia bacterium]